MIQIEILLFYYKFYSYFVQVLKLRNHFNISDILDYPKRYEIESQLQELVNSVKVPKVTFEVETAIRKLSQSKLKDFDIYRFTDNVSSQIPPKKKNKTKV